MCAGQPQRNNAASSMSTDQLHERVCAPFRWFAFVLLACALVCFNRRSHPGSETTS
jgi:hypothetical protein